MYNVVMKKFFVIFILLILLILPFSVNAMILEAGVSVDQIPKALYGNWRVSAKLDKTNSLRTFKPQSVDFWNLIRMGDNITLDNPYSGAKAQISVQTVDGNIVVFSKRLPYDNNRVLTDTVTIRLSGNHFSGINTLNLETFSLIDNHLLKSETATYLIEGEKISGDSIIPEEVQAP